MTNTAPMNRRKFFASTGAAAISVGATAASAATSTASAAGSDDMVYEVVRTEKEWLDRLETFDYFIMRKGLTEDRKSSALWNEERAGTYNCKGCDLHVYDGSRKADIKIGWVFFHHAQPNAVLTGIDGPVAEYGHMAGSDKTVAEVHCRRCGSHFGHMVVIKRKLVHCINGAALDFKPAEA